MAPQQPSLDSYSASQLARQPPGLAPGVVVDKDTSQTFWSVDFTGFSGGRSLLLALAGRQEGESADWGDRREAGGGGQGGGRGQGGQEDLPHRAGGGGAKLEVAGLVSLVRRQQGTVHFDHDFFSAFLARLLAALALRIRGPQAHGRGVMGFTLVREECVEDVRTGQRSCQSTSWLDPDGWPLGLPQLLHPPAGGPLPRCGTALTFRATPAA